MMLEPDFKQMFIRQPNFHFQQTFDVWAMLEPTSNNISSWGDSHCDHRMSCEVVDRDNYTTHPLLRRLFWSAEMPMCCSLYSRVWLSSLVGQYSTQVRSPKMYCRLKTSQNRHNYQLNYTVCIYKAHASF